MTFFRLAELSLLRPFIIQSLGLARETKLIDEAYGTYD